MRKAKFLSFSGALLILLSFGPALHAQRGWDFLGEAHVDGAVDHDNIVVTGARGEFRAIQIRVDGAAVRFDRVVVHYGNGSSEPIRIASRIAPGGSTRSIDLPGERRVIQSVEFWYAKASWGARPTVRLFGRH